jgi:hypothetical protein
MSIHHMTATDYYGRSYGYDSFVTMSNKQSVATPFFGFSPMDAGRAAQIYGRRIMVIAHF